MNMGFNNFNNGAMYNANYAAPPKQIPAYTQPLTQEDINSMTHSAQGFSMEISPEEMKKAICTHKYIGGKSALVPDDPNNADGHVTCAICGASFLMGDWTKEQVEEVCSKLIDIFQTCKALYLDVPLNLAKNYYPIIKLIEKFPTFYDQSVKNFSKYENPTQNLNYYGQNINGFAALNQILNGGIGAPYGYNTVPQYATQPQYNNYGYQPQPQMNMQYGTQPQYNNGYVAQQQVPMMGGYGNPMAYGTPMQGQQMPMQDMNAAPQQPAAPAPGVVPPAPQPAAGDVQNPAPEVQQQQVFNV